MSVMIVDDKHRPGSHLLPADELETDHQVNPGAKGVFMVLKKPTAAII